MKENCLGKLTMINKTRSSLMKIFIISLLFTFNCKNKNQNNQGLKNITLSEKIRVVEKTINEMNINSTMDSNNCWDEEHKPGKIINGKFLGPYLSKLLAELPNVKKYQESQTPLGNSANFTEHNWEQRLTACLYLMKQNPEPENVPYLKRFIETDLSHFSQSFPSIWDVFKEEAIQAITVSGCEKEYLWGLLKSQNDLEFHAAAVSLALLYVFEGNEENLNLLIEKVAQKEQNPSFAPALPYINLLVRVRDEAKQQQTFEGHLIHLFQYSFCYHPNPSLAGCLSEEPSCQYALKEFSSLLLSNLEQGVAALDAYTRKNPEQRLDFLRMLKDLGIPYAFQKDDEAKLKEWFGRPLEQWTPLTLPYVKIYQGSQNQR